MTRDIYSLYAEIDMLKEREKELTRALELAIVWLKMNLKPDQHSEGQIKEWRNLIDKTLEQTHGE